MSYKFIHKTSGKQPDDQTLSQANVQDGMFAAAAEITAGYLNSVM